MGMISNFLKIFEERIIYNSYPHFFDSIVRKRLSPIEKNLPLIPLIENKIVLDLGCGTAHLPIKLTKLSNTSFIIGLEKSNSLLKVALERKEAEKINNKRLYFIRADVHSIPFPDSSIDFIVSTGSLHHWNDVPKVLNEIFRVLKKNGQARIYDQKRCTSVRKLKKAFFDYKFVGLGLSALPDKVIKEYFKKANFPGCEFIEDDICVEIRLSKKPKVNKNWEVSN